MTSSVTSEAEGHITRHKCGWTKSNHKAQVWMDEIDRMTHISSTRVSSEAACRPEALPTNAYPCMIVTYQHCLGDVHDVL